MANNPKKRVLSKEAQANTQAGQVNVDAKEEPAKVLGPDEQRVVDLAKIKESRVGNNPKLSENRNIQLQHAEMIRDLQISIGEKKQLLSPGRDIIAKGLAPKLSTVEKAMLRYELTADQALLLKLTNSDKIVSKEVIRDSNADTKSIRLDILRDKVTDPNYYPKYGKFIVPAFDLLINSPMTKERRDKLSEAKSAPRAEKDEAITKLLQSEKPDLYIRATGSKELKPSYFAEFRKILERWQPRKAVIK